MPDKESFEDWKLRKQFEKEQQSAAAPTQTTAPTTTQTQNAGNSNAPPMINNDELLRQPDVSRKIAEMEKAGYIPKYAAKPIHLGLMRRFGGLPVVLDWIDVNLHTERAQWKGEKEYVVDPRNVFYHDHKAGKSIILYDMDKNLPLVADFMAQPNSKSADLQAIYGVKESFRQFIAGIRQEINRNVRQTIAMAIIFMVSGILIGHFI